MLLPLAARISMTRPQLCAADSLYFATRTLLPAKTRVFVDFVLAAFRRDRFAERFAGSLG
jgi:hypothetical protein